jgi:hypothetical protein
MTSLSTVGTVLTFDLCCYVNPTPHIQVARIVEIENWYFERVVFPGQRLLFEAPRNAHLEIHTASMASSILTDTIACESLKVRSSSYDRESQA